MRPAIVKKGGGQGPGAAGSGLLEAGSPRPVDFLSEGEFRRAIQREKGRTERSRNPFILLLLDVAGPLAEQPAALSKAVNALAQSTRDTDIVGWYETGGVLGVIFTEVDRIGVTQRSEMLLERVRTALGSQLAAETAEHIGLSIHIFPEDDEDVAGMGPVRDGADASSPMAYDLDVKPRTAALCVKRIMDIVGSLLALALFSPVLLAVAIAVKLTSKGPIFFTQQRVGLRGRTFQFIKFRSMKTDNDPAIHKAYMEQFIKSGAAAANEGQKPLYKIQNDPRLTSIGSFLRRTSLDEFPQFYNVLKGEMSLVGPRPPIPYEVNRYDMWHKRRYLTVKPGLTGLWQVHGRSRTTFDEMVRLDLLYARTWTIWGDVKILLQTPLAVVSGDGAK